jgi:mercuric ion transport protein
VTVERTTLLSNLGAVGSAFASALCCVGPILYVSLGVGAGLASTFEPLRPWFLGGAVLFLGLGFYGVYVRPPRSCEEGGTCETEEKARRKRRRQKVMLWASAGLVLLFATFPAWSTWLT